MSGTLFYVMGASGSGKDSLLSGCRAQLKANDAICVAHRYITRPPSIGCENHVCLHPSEFELRVTKGLFALHWDAHGYRYGIGCEIEPWLAAGLNVLVNGSRNYLAVAQARYPALVPVLIDVSVDQLAQRLIARGRENSQEIAQRLDHHQSIGAAIPQHTLIINNDGPLAEGVAVLLAQIKHYS